MITSNDEKSYIGFGKQALKGTPVTINKFARYLEDGLKKEQEPDEIIEGGNGQVIKKHYVSKHTYDGPVGLYARPDIAAFLLAMALGTAPTPSGGAAPYTHTVTPANTIPYMTVGKSIADSIIEQIQDCMIDEIEISGEATKGLIIKPAIAGGSHSIVSAATDTYEDDDMFRFNNCAFTVDGSGDTDITKFNIKIVRGTDKDIWGNSLTRLAQLATRQRIEVGYTKIFESEALWKKIYYGTSTSLVQTLGNGAFIVDANFGTGAAARQLKIDVPSIDYLEAGGAELNPDGKTVYYEVKGTATKGGSALATVTAKNATSTAYIG